MPVTWNYQSAAHLLRRAGFGATPAQVKHAVKAGFNKTLKGLLKPDKKNPKPSKKVLENTTYLQIWWLQRMVTTHRPLTEKLTVFWHNHFATANSKVDNLEYMQRHINMLRTNALGNFRDLLMAVTTDPAMLIWLDNKSNTAKHVNENYARELQELFTTGVLDKDGNPNYTETDVKEVARAFTGWGLQDGEFLFKPNKHDEDSKTVKGVTGNLDGGDVLDLLANDPATARRIPQKLFSYFAYPIDLADPICDELQAVYVANNGAISPIVEAIFRHDAFWSQEAQRALVKSPVEFMVGGLRLMRGTISGLPWDVGVSIQALGQSLYDPPSVFGWDGGLAWVSTSGMLNRARTAESMADTRGGKDTIHYEPKKLLAPKAKWKTLDAAGVVQIVLDALDLSDASVSTRAALETYAAITSSGDPVVVDLDYIESKVRGLIALVFSCPEFQMA